MFVKRVRIFRQNVAKFTHFRKNNIKFCSGFDEILGGGAVLSEFEPNFKNIFENVEKKLILNFLNFLAKCIEF